MTWKNNIGLKNKIKKKGNKKEKMFNSNKVVLLQQRFKEFVAGQKSKLSRNAYNDIQFVFQVIV